MSTLSPRFFDEVVFLNSFQDAAGEWFFGKINPFCTFQRLQLRAVIADDDTERLAPQHLLVVPRITAGHKMPERNLPLVAQIPDRFSLGCPVGKHVQVFLVRVNQIVTAFVTQQQAVNWLREVC